MKEFFLSAVFASNELHVINHQYIDRPEHRFEIHHFAVAQRLNKAVHELFCGQVQHIKIRATGLQFPCNRMHQVRFSKADTTIQKQRIEGHWSAFCDTTGGCMRQLVWFPDNEGIECKSRI